MNNQPPPLMPITTRNSILVRSLASLHRETILLGYSEAAHFIACARTSIEEALEMAREGQE